jgi:peptidoglycan/xylan/chitin deacetylase (PgdA/CDA1 family)
VGTAAALMEAKSFFVFSLREKLSFGDVPNKGARNNPQLLHFNVCQLSKKKDCYACVVIAILILGSITTLSSNDNLAGAAADSNSSTTNGSNGSVITTPSNAMTATKPCNCVLFRLDDVNDFQHDQTKTVLDIFLNQNASINPVLVMKNLGNNTDVIKQLAEGQKRGLFELGGHGWKHVFFNGTGYEQQSTWLSDMDNKMQDIFGRKPNVFSPPLAPFDDDTLGAMRELGIRILSSENEVDNFPQFVSNGSDIKDSEYGLYHVPGTVQFYDYSANIGVKVPISKIISNIQDSITKYGYAVVVLHPQDFKFQAATDVPAPSSATAGTERFYGPENSNVDPKDVSDLRQLINYLQRNEIPITTFSKLVEIPLQKVVDKHPPVLVPPPDIAIQALTDGKNPLDGSIKDDSARMKLELEKNGNVTLFDTVDPSPHVTNDAPNDGLFPIGTTTAVTWTAIDYSGNSVSAQQYVTIAKTADKTAPSVSISPLSSSTFISSSSPLQGNESIVYGSLPEGLNLNIGGNASDEGSGVKKIEVSISASEGKPSPFALAKPLEQASSSSPGSHPANWSEWSYPINITQAQDIQVKARATDYFNNVKVTSMRLHVIAINDTTIAVAIPPKGIEPVETKITINQLPDVFFGDTVAVSGKLEYKKEDASGESIIFAGMGNRAITLQYGTPSSNLSNKIITTNGDGTFSTRVNGPSSIFSSNIDWQIQANYNSEGEKYKSSSGKIEYSCSSIFYVNHCHVVK